MRIRNWRLTAEINGGRWKRAPVRVWRARGSAVGDGRASCRRRTQTYSLPGKQHRSRIQRARTSVYLPAPCCDLTSRVARSIQTMRHPVTLGSNVPLCPVFSTRRIRRNHATTSCDDGLDGLSRLIIPDLCTIKSVSQLA